MNSGKKVVEKQEEKKVYNNCYLKKIKLSGGPTITVYQTKKGLSFDIRYFSINDKGVEFPTQRGIRLSEEDMESLLEIKEEFSLPQDDECQKENEVLELVEEEEVVENKINQKQKNDQSLLGKKKAAKN